MCDGGRKTGDELRDVIAAAERLRARSVRPASGAAIAAELVALRHAIDLQELEFAALTDTLAESGHWEADGSNSPQDFIRHHTRMSSGAAAAAVMVGAHTAELRESTAAVEGGRIG